MKNKTTMLVSASACVALLVATGALAPATAIDDVNPIPDFVQGQLCGPPGIRDLINEDTDWYTGTCESPDEYWHPMLTMADCPGCDEDPLVSVFDETLVASHSSPPVPLNDVNGTQVDEGTLDHPVGTLEGAREDDHPAGPRYCLYFTPEGGDRQLLQCVDPTGVLFPLMPEFERELLREPVEDVPLTPPVEEGDVLEPQESPRVSYDLHVGYRWNDSLLHMQLGPGLVEYWTPVNPGSAEDVGWWVDNGYRTSFDVVFVVHTEGESSRGVGLHWPFLGQVLAANDKNQEGVAMP